MPPLAGAGLQRVRVGLAWAVIAGGALIFLGWLMGPAPAAQAATPFPVPHPATALLLIVAGAALATAGVAARLLALPPFGLGLGATALHGAQLLCTLPASLSGDLAAALPVPSMTAILILGGAALLLRESRRAWAVWAAQICAGLLILVALRALVGLVPSAGGQELFVPSATGVDLPSAGLWLLLGVGVLVSRPDAGFSELALSPRPAGQLLRWLVAVGNLLLLLIAVISEVAWRAGLFGPWTDIALLVVGQLIMFYCIAALFERADQRRRSAEELLARLNTDLERRVAERTTAIERDHRYQAALFASSQALLPTAVTPAAREAALVEVTRQLLAAANVSRVMLTRNSIDDAGAIGSELLALSFQPGYMPGATSESLRQGPWGEVDHELQQVMRRGEPVVGSLEQLSARFPSYRALLEAMGVRSMLALSLRVGDTWWGTLSLQDCDTPRTWDEHEILLLRTTAQLVSAAIQRWSDEDALRRGEHERLALERKLLEAQHSASMGVLVGGVAHDFNNILAAILGHAELARLDLAADSDLAASLDAIVRGAERATALTAQMLAYAGRSRALSAAIDLSAISRAMGELLRQSLPAAIELRQELAEGLPMVMADEGQVRQLLLSLLANAAEAIEAAAAPEGRPLGLITIATGIVELGEDDLGRATVSAAAPGRYCYLEVRDSGVGIDRQDLSRIFDPFFSTKFKGRGLGLAAVQGIVRAHNGALFVWSAPGQGATFRVCLPAGEP
jgi:signal transduction histidine kinase